MKLEIQSSLGPVVIIVRIATENLMKKKTCFRGKDKACAGNFFLFESPEEIFKQQIVLESLLLDLPEAIRENYESNSIEVEFEFPIGWSGTDNIKKYGTADLEKFNLNKKASGLRIKINRRRILAPITNLMTVVYEVKNEDGKILVIIHSFYPGPDIGEIIGNVSNREQRVFFDWNHPGSPIDQLGG